jgi:superfamily II DNA/RNA helicase
MKQSQLISQALEALKIESLNPMQEASIDAWKEGKDLILLSPTGSGKTLAYLLPLLESLNPEEKGVQAVVLVPSRELALQIDQVFKSMNTPYKVMS